MSVITIIAAGDQITNSRTDINTNFTNLNAGKIETSVIDTDTALAANSDAKIPSQKAVKAYVDTGGNVNASTTVRGIVEEATQAEVDAGTATGGTGARLFVNPSTLASVVTGNFGNGVDGDVTISSPTTLTSDKYYNNLVVNSVLTTDGYRIFVKGTISGSGTIKWGIPNAGSNASGITAGAGGAQSGGGIHKNLAGAIGGATNGQAGTAGAASNPGIGAAGGAGGTGGLAGVGPAGIGGGGGALTAPVRKFGIVGWSTIELVDLASGTIALLRDSGGGGGGGAGGTSAAGNHGAAGGGGASGGLVFIAALIWAGTFTISVPGANGGSGAAGTSSSLNAGGGGGGGGGGGVSVVVYGSKTWSGTYTLTGGTGGTAGSGASNGSTGPTGLSYEINKSTLL